MVRRAVAFHLLRARRRTCSNDRSPSSTSRPRRPQPGRGGGSGTTDGTGRFAITVSLGWHRVGTVLLIQAVGRRSGGGGAFYRFTV